MQKKILSLAAIALIFSLAACNNKTQNNDKETNATEQNTTEKGTAVASKDEDTLSISAGSNGVNVKSDKADVNVNKEGTSVKTKDVKIKLGDSDKK